MSDERQAHRSRPLVDARQAMVHQRILGVVVRRMTGDEFRGWFSGYRMISGREFYEGETVSDEQRVRTMCGWVGVEISKSRARKRDNPEFGLYRVRAVAVRAQFDPFGAGTTNDRVVGEWTEYLFELEGIEQAVEVAIAGGTPTGPQDLVLFHPSPRQARGDRPAIMVPTRWTSAYRGRRDFGVPEVSVPVMLRPEVAHRVGALAALVDEGLVEMRHVPDGCVCEGTSALTMACVDLMMGNPDARGRIREQQAAMLHETPAHEASGCDKGGAPHLGPCVTARQRQREANNEFQREHLERRAYGLRARYAAKEQRNGPQLPPE